MKKPFYLFPILLLLFLLESETSFAQAYRQITGKVIDASTKEPLPFATIVFTGSEAVGTTTDFEGKYMLESKWGTDSLQASFLGYKLQTKAIGHNLKKQTIDFELQPESENLNTVVVSVKKSRYKRKHNPAVELIKNVMARKDENRMQGQGYFEYEKYEKTEFSLNNITDKFRKKKFLKKFQFLFDYVDTSEVNGKPYLPFYIREVASKVYYRKKPKSEKEYRQGINMTGMEEWLDNESLTMLNDMLYQQVDIYENNIFLFNQSFIGPLNEAVGNLFYRYYILDTIQYKGMEVIDLGFMPADKQDLGFKGHLYILNDSSYAVARAGFSFAKQINLNWINDLQLVQEFEKKDSFWILSKDQIVTDFAFSKKGMGIFGKRTVMYRGHIFNKRREPSIYDGADKTIEESRTNTRDTAFWNKARHEPLTEKEEGIYNMVDTLKHVRAFRNMMGIVSLAVSGYLNVGNFDIGSFGTFYSFNEVEGFRLKFGGTTTPGLFPKVQIEGFGAYGFRDRQWKYGMALSYSFRENFRQTPRHYLRFSYLHETNFVGQKFDFVQEETFFLSFKRGDASKMLFINAFELNYFYELPSDLLFKFSIKNQKHRPIGSLRFDYFTPEPQALEQLKITEFQAHIRWAPNEKYVQGKNFRHPVFGRNPIFNFKYAYGIKGPMGGQYNYHKFEFDAFKRIYVPPFGYTNAIVEAGKIWGKGIPYYLLLLPRGNQTFSYKRRNFNMMNYLEFANDAYLTWNIEHFLGGYFFNKVPLLKKLKLREVFTFKGVWGSLNAGNNPAENPGLVQFLAYTDGSPQTYTLRSKPYMEASAGIANIFKVVRVDLVKRLNYLDNPLVPQMFGVKGLGLRLKAGFDF